MVRGAAEQRWWPGRGRRGGRARRRGRERLCRRRLDADGEGGVWGEDREWTPCGS